MKFFNQQRQDSTKVEELILKMQSEIEQLRMINYRYHEFNKRRYKHSLKCNFVFDHTFIILLKLKMYCVQIRIVLCT